MSDATDLLETVTGVHTEADDAPAGLPPDAGPPGNDATPSPEEAVEALQALVVAVRAADAPQWRKAQVAAFLKGGEYIDGLGAARLEDNSTVEGLVAELASIQGMTEAVRPLRRAIREASKRAKEALRAARRNAASAPPAQGLPLDLALEPLLAGHRLPPHLRCPTPWELAPDGIFLLHVDGETAEVTRQPVATSPVLVTGRLTDVDDGTVSLHLEWPRSGRWLRRIVGRGSVMDQRALVSLAQYDLPVHSQNAGEIVRYLAAFEGANLTDLPCAKVTSHLGWQGHDGALGFLWGQRLITGADPAAGAVGRPEDTLPASWHPDWVALNVDAGTQSLVRAFHVQGTWEGWLAAAEAARPYPMVGLGILAALAPPLLHVIPEAHNFAVDWSGATSRGKTTTLRLAASVWGNPDDRGQSLIGSWDATRVGIERSAAVLSGLPLILDETKRAKHPSDVARVIYDVVNGSGRTRGSVAGLQETTHFRTVLLSTGEAPATSFTQDGGTRARVLSLRGFPFGETSARTASAANTITETVLAHYGHAGPRLVARLAARREAWPDIREAYRRKRSAWTEVASGNPVAGRIAGYVALLHVAGDIANGALHIPIDVQAALELAWAAALVGAAESDRPRDALELLHGWACANAARFKGREDPGLMGHPPALGWAGCWPPGRDLAVIPQVLTDLLKQQGYEYDGIVPTWRERGWLEHEAGRNTRRIDLGAGRPHCVVVRAEVLVTLGADS